MRVIALVVVVALFVVIALVMVVTVLVGVFITAPERLRIELGCEFDDGAAVVSDGRQDVLESLFEAKAVCHHEIGLLHRGDLLGRRCVVMGVSTDGHHDLDSGVVPDHVADHIPPHPGGHDDPRTVLGGFIGGAA